MTTLYIGYIGLHILGCIYWAALAAVQPLIFHREKPKGLRDLASQCINELDVSSGKQAVGFQPKPSGSESSESLKFPRHLI